MKLKYLLIIIVSTWNFFLAYIFAVTIFFVLFSVRVCQNQG